MLVELAMWLSLCENILLWCVPCSIKTRYAIVLQSSADKLHTPAAAQVHPTIYETHSRPLGSSIVRTRLDRTPPYSISISALVEIVVVD